MTENWRVKTASSLESTPPPNVGRLNSLPFSDILVTLICCLRSMLTNSFLFGANCSPVTVAPERLVPRYVKTGIVVILLVVLSALKSSVVRLRHRARLFPGGLHASAEAFSVKAEAAPFSGGLTVEPGTLFPVDSKGEPTPGSAASWNRPARSRSGRSDTPIDHILQFFGIR